MRTLIQSIMAVIFIWISNPIYAVKPTQSIVYTIPQSGATQVNPNTTIALQFSQVLNQTSLDNLQVDTEGSKSGLHTGSLVLADDQKTVIFTPTQPFAYGEQVAVKQDQQVLLSFTTSSKPAPSLNTLQLLDPDERANINPSTPTKPAAQTAKSYLTAPGDLPNLTVTVPAIQTAEGDLFFSNFNWSTPLSGSYLMIVDNSGEPIYYQKIAANNLAINFEKLSNGNLAYWDGNTLAYSILDQAYHLIDVIKPGNGYAAVDSHELQLLPNGHYLYLIYNPMTIDITAYGGSAQATVIGLVIQELDTHHNVVFEWRSWDAGHFLYTDSYIDLTTPIVDYVHGNALELDTDGNILLSSRHMAEITKINHQTGDIIWRLGGKNNQFKFINDPRGGFYFQHDIRRLANGDITLFDNHNYQYSRAVEYSLDEIGKTATEVWEFRNTPDTITSAMGDIQRLPNGNSLIGWGSGVSPLLTEVKPDGTKALEFALDASEVSYRSFRFPWHGYPTWAPALAILPSASSVQLAFSWNGATEISSYRVFGGATPLATTLITEPVKSGFETWITLLGARATYCYYRVMPVDNLGRTTQYSDSVYNPDCGNKQYFPVITTN